MTILLWRRHGAGRDHGAALWCLGPGHELLIGPVPTPLPVRVGCKARRTCHCRIAASRRRHLLRGRAIHLRPRTQAEREAPPAELETPEAAQAEFVSCDQTISTWLRLA